ncbi:esterase/lipase family protein [Streptomyces sp. NPDC002795]|uniref:esterase/lipase family protein n=1 Tax=Streptomyces sp. NPDC002795 TaxID=3364665 RepID=UPI0036CC31C2
MKIQRVPRQSRTSAHRGAAAALTALCLGAGSLATAATAQAAPAPDETSTKASASADTKYPVGDLGTVVHNHLFSPNAVAGANDWTCKPSAKHPYPVVLSHGAGANMGANWAALAPRLANEGYCVYAFNYGMHALSLGRSGGMTDIGESAKSMSAFVDRVLASTDAKKVDVVGHSEGGMMPNYYIKRLGGGAKVHTLVGMAPSNHGTTLSGLVTLFKGLNGLGLVNNFLDFAGLAGLKQQEVESDFQKELWKDGDTVRGVNYVVIQTKHDTVVTPHTNSFLRGDNVTNILLQDQCPDNSVGHMGVALDGPTLENIENVLGPNDPDFKPVCANYGPAV